MWAGWFRCIGDPTRLLILNRLAVARRPMSVNEVVEAVDVGQPTVSHHLKTLAEVGFVLVEARANSRLYRVNDHCLELFPSAAEVVMGRLPRVAADAPAECRVPWLRDAGDAEAGVDSGLNRPVPPDEGGNTR